MSPMMHKMVLWFERKFNVHVNEAWFSSAVFLLAVFMMIAAGTIGQATFANILGLLTGMSVNVGAFLVTVFMLEYFLYGTGFDANEELKKGNVAMAISILGLRLGAAIVIAKGIL